MGSYVRHAGLRCSVRSSSLSVVVSALSSLRTSCNAIWLFPSGAEAEVTRLWIPTTLAESCYIAFNRFTAVHEYARLAA